ncbi:dTDP-4-dehydrorhamnose reductase [Pseudohalocynthiibacter sp. F2068]|jgi:dTDP-4-dehydrorhamnose reductase|uniref:dTDP-4-dehydrorhamnose reductase n=1 Tax=Pseudohalocynthiibacter sp. F2068 TaxID=2926418 RepID=UPI001FF6F55B|nr:dTDP-4-dehydrorhamnose reductase [Pseudohalocynthiibacter sp. F2068]MCK0103877.1 dTDP-4-dehydrorhamnose reductase [Pseudohalocynthiibacter sp. F2068]
MRVLVFGATGQVARGLKAQADVIALSRADADLSNPEQCAAVIANADTDVVINAAAFTAVDKAEEQEDLATLVNGRAPGAMARSAAARGLPFIHISTDYVFDGSGSLPWVPNDPVAPLGAYGRSKLKGEEEVRAAGGLYAILRTSWVFSAHGGNFVKTMLRLSETHQTLRVVSDQIGGPTPADAIASACLSIAKTFNAGMGKAETYHFSGAPDVSWAEFAREIFAQAGRDVEVADIPTVDYPTPARRPMNSRMDCSSLQAEFGIARPDWKAGLSEVLKECMT